MGKNTLNYFVFFSGITSVVLGFFILCAINGSGKESFASIIIPILIPVNAAWACQAINEIHFNNIEHLKDFIKDINSKLEESGIKARLVYHI